MSPPLHVSPNAAPLASEALQLPTTPIVRNGRLSIRAQTATNPPPLSPIGKGKHRRNLSGFSTAHEDWHAAPPEATCPNEVNAGEPDVPAALSGEPSNNHRKSSNQIPTLSALRAAIKALEFDNRSVALCIEQSDFMDAVTKYHAAVLRKFGEALLPSQE